MLVSGVKNCSVHNELVGLCGVEDRSVPESPGPLFSPSPPLVTDNVSY